MSYEKKTSAGSNKKWGRRYDWIGWFALGNFVLEHGVDFNGRTDTMLSQVRQQAAKRGRSVTINVSDDGKYINVLVHEKRHSV